MALGAFISRFMGRHRTLSTPVLLTQGVLPFEPRFPT